MLRSPSEEYAGQVATLNPDQRAVVQREATDALFALKTLADFAAKEAPLPLDLAFSVLYTTEARVAELGKLLGIELDSAKARAERYAALRAANYRVANLQRELGQAASPATILPAVATLCEKVRDWWRKDGLGHVSEVQVGQYGMTVKLSCYLMFRNSLGSDSPVSDKQSKGDWYQSLEARGFALVYAKGEEPMVAATTENQRLLEELVRKAFPSARMATFTAHFRGTREGDHPESAFREFEVFLPELAEVAALPDLPPRKA